MKHLTIFLLSILSLNLEAQTKKQLTCLSSNNEEKIVITKMYPNSTTEYQAYEEYNFEDGQYWGFASHYCDLILGSEGDALHCLEQWDGGRSVLEFPKNALSLEVGAKFDLVRKEYDDVNTYLTTLYCTLELEQD